MIIGTAGHIDHGKTALVRALTGVDTDRLKEEKARGLSIELGYAYTELDDGSVLGFIDVPGHERLVHTMIAGACGIDFALLVIAADDGVMPQTREHLAILELLSLSRGAVALTKIDRVDSTRLAQVCVEVTEALASTALRNAPIFPVNAVATNDPGVATLRAFLVSLPNSTPSSDERLFRLAIDRVFTLTGHGTIVTGTVFSGVVRTGDSVCLMPAGKTVRVRSIHAQNRPADSGHAGQRCALNLVGIDKHAISRGDWVADARALAPTTRLDVHLQLLAGSHLRLGTWSPLHVHLGASHRLAHAVPLDNDSVGSGRSTHAQLIFDSPVCAVPGDRFIARDTQATHTIGGGVVLDPYAPARRRRSMQRLRYLTALERMIAGDGVDQLLQEAPFGIESSDLVCLTGHAFEHIALPRDSVVISTAQGRYVLLTSHWKALRERVIAALRDFHVNAQDEPGPDSARLRRIALPDLCQSLWLSLIEQLTREGLVTRQGSWLRLPEHTAVLSADDRALAQKIQPLIAEARFDPPWVRELAEAVREPEDRVREVLRKQVMQGAAFQVVHDLFYDSERIGELADLVTSLAHEHGAVHAAHYRDAIGLGRKRAIQILEFFDRTGFTRRMHDAHVLRGESGWRSR